MSSVLREMGLNRPALFAEVACFKPLLSLFESLEGVTTFLSPDPARAFCDFRFEKPSLFAERAKRNGDGV